jgi:hypothetical protein
VCQLSDGVFTLQHSAGIAEMVRRRPVLRPEATAPSLVSAHEIVQFDVEAPDGSLGIVEELVVHEVTWDLSHIVVDGRRWWPGRYVRVAANAIAAVDPASRMLHTGVTRTSLAALSVCD